MKKHIFILFNLRQLITMMLVFVLTFSLVFIVKNTAVTTVSDNISKGMTVIVDAGHGGEDAGTQSSAGVLEKGINLDISLKIGTLLRLMGYSVVYTRTEDILQYPDDAVRQRQKKVSDIHYRMSIMQKYPDAVFLSIHQNYFTQSKYHGAQVFYSQNNEQSKMLAEKLQTSIRELLQPENDRQIKASDADIYLLYHAELPAVMVECGFMSNPGEALLLSDSEYQKKISLAVAAGIEEYTA